MTDTHDQQLAAAYAGTHLESMCELDIDSPPHVHRMSGIICTIGRSLFIAEILACLVFLPISRTLLSVRNCLIVCLHVENIGSVVSLNYQTRIYSDINVPKYWP